MDFTIVPITDTHLDQIEALEKICFSDPWSRKTLEDIVASESGVNLAAVDPAGLVLGYISLYRVLDEGYINNVAVRPEARRAGPRPCSRSSGGRAGSWPSSHWRSGSPTRGPGPSTTAWATGRPDGGGATTSTPRRTPSL